MYVCIWLFLLLAIAESEAIAIHIFLNQQGIQKDYSFNLFY